MGQYDDTLGLLLIASFFNTFLFGIVTLQYCVYFTNYNDRRTLKTMVCFMFLLDAVHSAAYAPSIPHVLTYATNS